MDANPLSLKANLYPTGLANPVSNPISKGKSTACAACYGACFFMYYCMCAVLHGSLFYVCIVFVIAAFVAPEKGVYRYAEN